MRKNSIKLIVRQIIAGLSFLFLVCPIAHSVDFPKKPIKIVMSTPPGSGEDTEARGVAPFLEKHLGVKVLIENQPGAGGKIALEKFQKTVPDGYTLTIYNFPKSIILEYMGKVNFRTKDFTPIYGWVRNNTLLAVHTDTWKTFAEFLETAREKTLTGGISGRGGVTHVAGLVAMDALGLKVNWVPFEGSAQSTMSLAGKHIDFTVTLTDGAAHLIRAGRLRALAFFTDERDPTLADVPTAKELGFNIKTLTAIRCAVAPPNLPANTAKILEQAFSKAVREPAYLEWAKNRKSDVRYYSAKEFSKIVTETYPLVEKFQPMFSQ